MKKCLILLFLVWAAPVYLSNAQGKLTGEILDEKGQPVGFGSVAVLKTGDSTVVTGIIAGPDGSFGVVAPAVGSYFLKVSLFGYAPLHTPSFTVTDGSFSKDFGKMVLKEDAKVLGEVVITTMRPTVIAYSDKLVVNVAGSALAGGATAYEVLTQSPGIWADAEGNLRLNGKAGVQVMIDGRPAYLTGKELQNLLQSMPAGNIKELELINNPSAKYDAEGVSGIININLKKNTAAGMNGSVYAGYQYSELHGYTGGADLNYKQGRLSAFANLDVAERTNFRVNKMSRTYQHKAGQLLQQEVHEQGKRLVPSLRLGADYAMNSRHSVGYVANLSSYTSRGQINTNASLRDGQPAHDLFINAANNSRTKYGNTTLNLHYLGKPDTLGATLTANLDYARLTSNDLSVFANSFDSLRSESGTITSQMNAENPTHYTIFSGRLDYKKPLAKAGTIETGVKASSVHSDNEVRFYQVLENAKEPDPARSNHFLYQENILAAYVNYAASLGKKWGLQGGLRAEQTLANGRSVTLAQQTRRNYLDLFPSLQVQQTINDNYQISYSYSRRISRPGYKVLNPFVLYVDPYSLVMGNPYLKPQYSRSLSVTQTLQQRYNLIFDYTSTKDYITEIPAQNPTDNVTVFQQQNVADMKSVSATLVTPVQVNSRWEMNNNATVLYQYFAVNGEEKVLKNSQVTVMAQLNQKVQLPAGLRLELTTGYRGPVAYGLYRIHANWWTDAGIKRSFLNDKLDLSLTVTDVFRSKKISGTTRLEGYSINSDQYQGTQSFRVNLRYRFNKGEKVEVKKRQINLEEVHRAGEN